MSRSRMFDDDVPEREEQAEPAPPRTTIVGGRPPEAPPTPQPIPTGIQRLLRLAVTDADFRARLLSQRDEVAEAVGVTLTATERAVLRAASVAQLETMARHLPPRASPRREFFRQTAVTAAALLGAPALVACEGAVKGIRPDEPPPSPSRNGPYAQPPPEEPPPRPTENPMQGYGGAAPDEPPPPPPKYPPPPGGVRPDLPPEPERPNHTSPTRGISPDVPPKSE